MMTTLIDESALTQLLRGVLGQARNLVSYRFLRKATDFARSATIAQVVRSCSGVQTYEVLAVDTSARRWPWQYLVTTWCPGQLWSAVRPRKKNGEARALYISLGAAIGQMHTIGFSTCGEITSDGMVLAGTSYTAALRRRAQRRIANPAHVALFLSVLQEHHALFEALPAGVLCHEDLNPGNLLVQELPAGPPALWVLDFDSAWAGCAESDLARLEFWRGMMGEGFWEAYRTFAPLSDSYSQRGVNSCQNCRTILDNSVLAALDQSGLLAFPPRSGRLSHQVMSARAYGPGLLQRGVPPQAFALRPVAGESGLLPALHLKQPWEVAFCVAANAIPDRTSDARSLRR